jgi:hypothetical protein
MDSESTDSDYCDTSDTSSEDEDDEQWPRMEFAGHAPPPEAVKLYAIQGWISVKNACVLAAQGAVEAVRL